MEQYKTRRNTIAHQHIQRLMLSLAAGFLVFFVLYQSTGYLTDQYLNRTGYYTDHEKMYVSSLQKYVRENHVSSEDTDALEAWGQGQENIFFQVYEQDDLIYQYYSRGSKSLREAASMDFLEWIDSYPLQMEDGAFQVIVFGAFDYRPFNFAMVLNVLGAFAVFLVIFLTGIRKRTRYITKLRDEIEILGGGDLDYEVSVRGNDELTDLADNLNQMRQALKHHMEEEARLTEERQIIVTRLSHDIRTPLTSMNLFIDLLKQGRYEDEAQREHYLDRIQESAENLTGLTEELFQAARSPLQDLSQPTEEAGAKAGYAGVIKILSDAAEALRLSGFMVEENYEVRDPSELMVAMDRPDFARVMDNITSNILRYADPTEEIHFACRSREDETVLTFTNRTCPPEMEEKGGSGIGLANVRRLMQKAGGSMKAGVDGENFVVELVFHRAVI